MPVIGGLILYAEQYRHYCCYDVVADELPSGATDRVAILGVKLMQY